MIQMFTDFGWAGPYVGQMRTAIVARAPEVPVIDLMHDAPAFNPRASAYLLAALTQPVPPGTIILAVVDPGVGHPDRRPIAIRAGRRWLVGPDNGLLAIAARNWPDPRPVWREITWRPDRLSPSFHGRDLFAPIAAEIALGHEARRLAALDQPGIGDDWPSQRAEVIYVDRFGNAVTGLRAADLSTDTNLTVGNRTLKFAETFSAVPAGNPFWYRNAFGLVEIAVNRGRADQVLALNIGDPVARLESSSGMGH